MSEKPHLPEEELSRLQGLLLELQARGEGEVAASHLGHLHLLHTGRELLPRQFGFPSMAELLGAAAERGACTLAYRGGGLLVSAPALATRSVVVPRAVPQAVEEGVS